MRNLWADERLSIRMISASGRELLASMGLELNIAAMETDLIIKEVTGYDRLHIMLNLDELVEKAKSDRIMELLRLRSTSMPMAYVLGHREFMGLDFYCERGVLIPRPDTEVLVETVMENLSHGRHIYGIEIGAGTGIISLSLLSHFPELSMIAGDINEQAIELARKNARYVDEQNGDIEKYFPVRGRFSVVYSDLFKNIEPLKLYDSENHEDLYDFIVSNPPYIHTHVIDTLMSDVSDFE
ncbi:MAG: HemK/PrmC family methyltransferase, partial [Proteocatella sp.]